MMETMERRRSASAKTSKKGGKRVKPLTAEEEARRREELKEKLRERVELERRALKVVQRLLEDSVTEEFLVDCAKFITPANYKDIVEERSISKLCGYPVCATKLGKIPSQQFKISTKTNRVYDITERKMFCCNFCYKASKEFELQISKTPLWLRQHESPPEMRLLKKGDGGSSGEEVMLSDRCLKEEDIENPLASPPDGPCNYQQSSAGAAHGNSSDDEQEQDFVSSMVSQQQKPRVHWGELPKRTDEDNKGKQEEVETRQKLVMEGYEDETDCQTKEKEEGKEPSAEEELHKLNTDQEVQEKTDLHEDQSVEEATAKINTCTLSEMVVHNANLPEHTPTQTETNASLTSPPVIETKPLIESKHPPSSPLTVTSQDSHSKTSSKQASFSITQVGMSKRGAAGLRDLLRNQTAEAKPDAVQLNLLGCLRRTLKEWCTAETMKFLYGIDHSLASSFADIKEETDEKDEDLDEDDLEDDVTLADAGEQTRPSAAAPDYETLRKETQQMELRVREFYKGTYVLPEEELHANEATVQDRSRKDPVLPLIDSHAQQLIQKKITVEKLSSCLRNIVGPLGLTMSDVSTDLNNLVRTFRFTNTSIIHKTPEWTLIAVVLLHLLSEVSPVVREALEAAASLEYLNTLMEELGLQEQNLLNLVQQFKSPTH